MPWRRPEQQLDNAAATAFIRFQVLGMVAGILILVTAGVGFSEPGEGKQRPVLMAA